MTDLVRIMSSAAVESGWAKGGGKSTKKSGARALPTGMKKAQPQPQPQPKLVQLGSPPGNAAPHGRSLASPSHLSLGSPGSLGTLNAGGSLGSLQPHSMPSIGSYASFESDVDDSVANSSAFDVMFDAQEAASSRADSNGKLEAGGTVTDIARIAEPWDGPHGSPTRPRRLIDQSLVQADSSKRYNTGKLLVGSTARTMRAPGRSAETSAWMSKVNENNASQAGSGLVHPLAHLFKDNPVAQKLLNSSYALGVEPGDSMVSDVHHVGSLVTLKDPAFGQEYVSMTLPGVLHRPRRGLPLSEQFPSDVAPGPATASSGSAGETTRGSAAASRDASVEASASAQGEIKLDDDILLPGDAALEGVDGLSTSLANNESSTGEQGGHSVRTYDPTQSETALRNILVRRNPKEAVLHKEPGPGAPVGAKQIWGTSEMPKNPYLSRVMWTGRGKGASIDKSLGMNKRGFVLPSANTRLPPFVGGGWVPDKLSSQQPKAILPYVFRPMGGTRDVDEKPRAFFGGFGPGAL